MALCGVEIKKAKSRKWGIEHKGEFCSLLYNVKEGFTDKVVFLSKMLHQFGLCFLAYKLTPNNIDLNKIEMYFSEINKTFTSGWGW